MYWSLPLLVNPYWLFHRARQSDFVRDPVLCVRCGVQMGTQQQKYGAGFLYILGDLCPWRDYVCIEFLENGTYSGLSKGSAKGVDGGFVPLAVRNENARHLCIPLS